ESPSVLVFRTHDDPHSPHSFPTRRSSDPRKARLPRGEQDRLPPPQGGGDVARVPRDGIWPRGLDLRGARPGRGRALRRGGRLAADRKSTRLNSSHVKISYAVSGLKKKNHT